jgi:hypothetical protein
MVSQLDVELFSKVAGMSPKERGILILFSVALTNVFRCWKDPGNDREGAGFFTFAKG